MNVNYAVQYMYHTVCVCGGGAPAFPTPAIETIVLGLGLVRVRDSGCRNNGCRNCGMYGVLY